MRTSVSVLLTGFVAVLFAVTAVSLTHRSALHAQVSPPSGLQITAQHASVNVTLSDGMTWLVGITNNTGVPVQNVVITLVPSLGGQAFQIGSFTSRLPGVSPSTDCAWKGTTCTIRLGSLAPNQTFQWPVSVWPDFTAGVHCQPGADGKAVTALTATITADGAPRNDGDTVQTSASVACPGPDFAATGIGALFNTNAKVPKKQPIPAPGNAWTFGANIENRQSTQDPVTTPTAAQVTFTWTDPLGVPLQLLSSDHCTQNGYVFTCTTSPVKPRQGTVALLSVQQAASAPCTSRTVSMGNVTVTPVGAADADPSDNASSQTVSFTVLCPVSASSGSASSQAPSAARHEQASSSSAHSSSSAASPAKAPPVSSSSSSVAPASLQVSMWSPKSSLFGSPEAWSVTVKNTGGTTVNNIALDLSAVLAGQPFARFKNPVPVIKSLRPGQLFNFDPPVITYFNDASVCQPGGGDASLQIAASAVADGVDRNANDHTQSSVSLHCSSPDFTPNPPTFSPSGPKDTSGVLGTIWLGAKSLAVSNPPDTTMNVAQVSVHWSDPLGIPVELAAPQGSSCRQDGTTFRCVLSPMEPGEYRSAVFSVRQAEGTACVKRTVTLDSVTVTSLGPPDSNPSNDTLSTTIPVQIACPGAQTATHASGSGK